MVKSESKARNRSLEMSLDLSRFFDDVHAAKQWLSAGKSKCPLPILDD